jgi:hypothetical protein
MQIKMNIDEFKRDNIINEVNKSINFYIKRKS